MKDNGFNQTVDRRAALAMTGKPSAFPLGEGARRADEGYGSRVKKLTPAAPTLSKERAMFFIGQGPLTEKTIQKN